MVVTEAVTDWEATRGLLPQYLHDLRPNDLTKLKGALGLGGEDVVEKVEETLLMLSTGSDAEANRGEGGGLLAQVLRKCVSKARVGRNAKVEAATARLLVGAVEMERGRAAEDATEEEAAGEGGAAQEPAPEPEGRLAAARGGEPEIAAVLGEMRELRRAYDDLKGSLEVVARSVQAREGAAGDPVTLRFCAADSDVLPGTVGVGQTELGKQLYTEAERMKQELCLKQLYEEQGESYDPVLNHEKPLKLCVIDLKQSQRLQEWSVEYKKRMEEIIRKKAHGASPKHVTEIKAAYEGLFGRPRGILRRSPVDQTAIEVLLGSFYAAGAGLKFGTEVGAAFREEMDGATGFLDGEGATAFVKNVQKRNKALDAITKGGETPRKAQDKDQSGNGGGKPHKG